MRERPARRRRSRRALSVGQKGSQRTVANFSSVDKVDGREDGRREVAGRERRRWGKGSEVGSSGKGRRRRGETSRSSIAPSSSEVQLNIDHFGEGNISKNTNQPPISKVGSKETIRPTASVSEFSTHSAEME